MPDSVENMQNLNPDFMLWRDIKQNRKGVLHQSIFERKNQEMGGPG